MLVLRRDVAALAEEIAALRGDIQVFDRRLTAIETTLPHLTTKADMAQSFRTQTFALVVILTGIMFTLLTLMR